MWCGGRLAVFGLVLSVVLSGGCSRHSPTTPKAASPPDTVGECPRVREVGAWDDYPTWSPGDTLVAYIHAARSRTDSLSLYIVHADTGEPSAMIKLLDPFASELAWSPDGRYIALSYQQNIWVCDVHTGLLAQWTHTAWYAADPAWSPDGRKLIFQVSIGDSVGMYVLDTTTRSQVRLMHAGVPLGSASTPCMSPNGSLVAIAWPAAGPDIYVASIDGSSLQRITQLGGSALDPQWSPDGSKLFFDFTPGPCLPNGAANRATWTVDASGQSATRWVANLGDPSAQFGFPFAISHDGARAAYVGVDSTGLNAVIWTEQVDGTHRKQISWR